MKDKGGDMVLKDILISEDECENALVEIANGDMDSLAFVYRAYGRVIYSIAYQLTRSSHDAEDVLQDTMLKIAEKANLYTKGKSPRAWVLAIAHNLALDKLRSSKGAQSVDLLDDDQLPEVGICGDDTICVEVAEALGTLTTNERLIVEMKVYRGMSHSEIASVMGCTAFAVRKRYSRAMNKLKLYFKE